MRVFFTSMLICIFFTSFSYAQIDSIYNDDPTQYLPLGMKVADYHPYTSEGKTVEKPNISPPFWWTGMANKSLEIMIYDQNIKNKKASISSKKGISLVKVHHVENPNYLFIELNIDPSTEPGSFDIVLSSKEGSKQYSYELKQRLDDKTNVEGIHPSDLIYLIMPDRFANGDYSNDSYQDMRQSGIHRGKMYFRHGGDLQGIIDHLDYLKELGVTALWLNPVLENDQPYASYHGYAITDHYKIDARFGTNELYKTFVEACHKKGIKVIMDIIFNHCGHEHWLMKDIPSEDWIHQWPKFTKSNFRSSVLFDDHASKSDTEQLLNGWFDYSMPDLNQKNDRLSTYFIQNTIWWVEYSGQDAYRIDTWFFPDQDFLSIWSKRMKEEFPNLGMFGETWTQTHAVQASFVEGNTLTKAYDPHLPQITDFQLNFAIEEALTKPQSWTGGIAKVYYTIAQDYLYKNPNSNITFLDNHDKTRFFSTINEDINKYKSGLAFLLTMRGTPSIYYGTELLFSGVSDPDGKVRQDFQGGWKEDSINLFQSNGRSIIQNEAFNYVKKLANYRKNNPALYSGELLHFIPIDGIYVYFRYNDDKTIMVIMNTTDKFELVNTDRFKEILIGHTSAKNIITDQLYNQIDQLKVDKNATLILELIKDNDE